MCRVSVKAGTGSAFGRKISKTVWPSGKRQLDQGLRASLKPKSLKWVSPENGRRTCLIFKQVHFFEVFEGEILRIVFY